MKNDISNAKEHNSQWTFCEYCKFSKKITPNACVIVSIVFRSLFSPKLCGYCTFNLTFMKGFKGDIGVL